MQKNEGKPPDSKRGRIPRSAYEQAVSRMLTKTWDKLDKCEILTQLDIVQHLSNVNSKKYPTPGFAVRELLDLAINQVIKVTVNSENLLNLRIAIYLSRRLDGESTAYIADKLELSREYVSRTIAKCAAQLVTERVLQIAKRKLAVAQPEPSEPIIMEEKPAFIRRRTGFRKG